MTVQDDGKWMKKRNIKRTTFKRQIKIFQSVHTDETSFFINKKCIFLVKKCKRLLQKCQRDISLHEASA